MVFKRTPAGRLGQAREGDSSSLSSSQEGHKAPASGPSAAAQGLAPGGANGMEMEGTRDQAAGVAPGHGSQEGDSSPAPPPGAATAGPVAAEPTGHAPADSRPSGGIPTEGSSASSSSPHGSASGRSAGLLAGTWSPMAEPSQGFSPSPLLTPEGGREGATPGGGRGGVGSRSSRSYYEAASRVVSSLAHVGSVSARTHQEAAERATRSPSGASPFSAAGSSVSASGRGYAEIAGRAVRLWDSKTLYGGGSPLDGPGLASPGRTAGLPDPGFSFGRAGTFKSLGLKKGFLDRYRVGEGLGAGHWSKVYTAESVRGAGAGASSSRAASEVSAVASVGRRPSGAPPVHRGPVAGAASGVNAVDAALSAIELEGRPRAREAGVGPDAAAPSEQGERGQNEASGAGVGAGGEDSVRGVGGGREGAKQGAQGGSWISRQLRRITEGKQGQGQGKVPVVISSNDFAPGAAEAAAEARQQRRQEEGGAERGEEGEEEEEGCYTRVPPMSGYAVKIIEKEKCFNRSVQSGGASGDAFESVVREVEAQRLLSGACPGQVVRLVEAYEDLTSIFLLMERCEGGDLVAEMLARGAKLEEADVRRAMRNLLLALAHCALHGVVHRDVKPDNLLLARPSDLTSMKLCDFGLAVLLAPGETVTGCMGTAAYAAPEVLAEQAYGAPADVWSAGAVAFTLLAGARPFWGKTFVELVAAVRQREPCLRGPAWEGVSAGAREFVSLLLTKDPRLRPSPVQALCHPWIHSPQLGAALPLDWKLLVPPAPAPGAPTPSAAEPGEASRELGAGGGASGARLEANYLEAQTRCVRLADGKRTRLDKTQRARLEALAKMPGEELQRTASAVLQESVLGCPAMRRGGEGGGEGGRRKEEEAEAEGPMPRHLAAVTEEEA